MTAAAASAAASSSGKTSNGYSASQGCNQCHGGGVAPKVALTGPVSLQPGEQGTFTLTITDQSGGQQPKGGLTVAAPGGQFAIGGPDSASTQLKKGTGGRQEVVQKASKAGDNGVVTFSFLWTAPGDAPAGTTIDFTGWGNAVNGTGSASGDKAARATLGVTIADAPGEGGAAGAAGSGSSGQAGAGSEAGSSATAGTSAAGAGDGGQGGDGGTAGQPDEGASGSDSGVGGSDSETGGSGEAGGSDEAGGSKAAGVSGASGQTSGATSGGCRAGGGAGGGAGAALVAVAMLASLRRRRD